MTSNKDAINDSSGHNTESSNIEESHSITSSIENMFIPIRNNEEHFANNIEIMDKITTHIITNIERNRNRVVDHFSQNIKKTNEASYRRIFNCWNLNDTSFATKIDLAADYQGSNIMFVSDQTFGPVSNLIKTTITKENKEPWERENEEDGFQNGWLVKRHEPNAFAVIQLGVGGTVSGVDVDLTGYKKCAPITVSIVGHLRDSPGKWTKILPKVFVDSDSHNFFETKNSDIYSHIQITMVPGSGITRLRVYGDVVPSFIPVDEVVNLASNMFGSQVVQKPVNILRGYLPNIILNRADSSHDGWISARDKNTSGVPQYTIIKLATKGIIDRFVVDTKHFIGNAPKSIIIQGCSINGQDFNSMKNIDWVNLIDEEDQVQQNIFPNMIHIIPCIYSEPITHIRVQPIPDGGIQQIIAKGRVYLQKKLPLKETQKPEPTISGNKRKRKNDDEKPKRVSSRLFKAHK